MINVSLIGGGNIAKAHAAAAKALPDRVKIAAVVDPNPSAAGPLAEQLGAKLYPGIDALIADEAVSSTIRAAIVCTPPSARVEPVAQALEMGWSVLCEKPLAHRLDDSTHLSNLAKQHPQQACAAGLCHRFTPAVDRMIEAVRGGLIGPVLRVENVFAASIPTMATHWMSDPAVSGGGSLLDAGTHSIDLMHHLVGPCDSAGAVLEHAWPGRGDSNATVLLRSLGGGACGVEPGVACHLASGWAEPTRFHLRLVGRDGSLFYDFEAPTELLHAESTGGQDVIEVETHEVRFTRQLAAFLNGVEAGAVPAPLASFADAHAVMALLGSIDGALVDRSPVIRAAAEASA
ncbi:MAG: Gfo/Idh/MocA family oxidoreductase [Planctomycetota bacterium]